MKRILMLALSVFALSAQSALIIYNISDKSYASLRMLSGPYRGQCLSSLLTQGGAWSQKGYPSRPINDMELSSVCGRYPCLFSVYLGSTPNCTQMNVGTFDMLNSYQLRLRSQTVPHYGLDVSEGLITVYKY